MKKTGASLLADCLVKHGVKTVFGIPGAKIDALFDALLDTPIEVILCHHEQNAVFMAQAHGRLTGKPGVVIVTSGPGVGNLITGLLTATTEGDPVVAIGGNVPRSMKLKESHQGTDNIKITEAATKDSLEVMMVENIPEVIENSFRIAQSPRSGAVFISVAQDLLSEPIEMSAPDALPSVHYGPAPEEMINKAAKILNNAKKPVIFLGQECSRPKNTKIIRELLKQTPFPVVMTYQAAGVICC